MKLDFVGTYAFNRSLQVNSAGLQRELSKVQTELATGRVADIGSALGYQTSRSVNLEAQIDLFDQIKSFNGVLTNRLTTMQDAMNSIVDGANGFMGEMGAAIGGHMDRSVLQGFGDKLLGTVTQFANATFNGEYVFSGVNTDVKAVIDFQGADWDAAKQEIEDAFQAHFGFASSDAQAATITKTDMETFIDGPYADLFNDTNWNQMWSGASDRGVRSRISSREIVENPVTANDAGFRKVVSAGVLLQFMAGTSAGGNALNAAAESAMTQSANGLNDLANSQGRLGVIEQRVSDAQDRIAIQKNLLNEQLNSLIGVDQYEVATRLNQLVINLEASYAASSKIQSLSLMNYL
ncbi:MAG: flagellar hook-associated family protein [Nitratireductor sp.]|nr:flagellar hook-associated family protein [Nitratireductor sp.]MCC0019931.1 flagellar hook-associated family protein [Nitratireductor sp.]